MNRELLYSFSEQIENQVPDMRLRNRVAATAIAVAISQSRHLPSAPTESASAYYVDQVLPMVINLVSRFNEAIVMDTDGCLEMVRQFWMVRYVAAFPPVLPIYEQNASFFDILTGVGTQVAPELICFVSGVTEGGVAHSKMIYGLVPFAADLVASIRSDLGEV